MDYQQYECVLQLLMGLNESFSQMRAQILMMDPLPTINKVFSLVVRKEISCSRRETEKLLKGVILMIF